MKELQSGNVIEVEGQEFQLIESSAHIYNSWVKMKRPLPFVYVWVQAVDGQRRSVHVTQIDEYLSSLETETGTETPSSP